MSSENIQKMIQEFNITPSVEKELHDSMHEVRDLLQEINKQVNQLVEQSEIDLSKVEEMRMSSNPERVVVNEVSEFDLKR
jgi:cell fate (sporulation/competence/biofilm development) regulator YmcA (YheA/YmcA/DUF963 family)